jgi:hypothetical protein
MPESLLRRTRVLGRRVAQRASRATLVALVSITVHPDPARAAEAGIPVARVAVVGPHVERQASGRGWEPLTDGAAFRTGDRLRCSQDSLARVDFPWTTILVSPGTLVELPASRVLSVRLENGRLEQRATAGDIIKVRTAEGLVEGRGYLIVWRREGVTAVTSRAGRFRARAAGRTLALEPGSATLIESGKPPQGPRTPPPAPRGLVPGADPLYVSRGDLASLSWVATAPTSHIEVAVVGSEQPLIHLEAEASPQTVRIPWPGTYRWRVSGRDETGIEGLPSRDGLICVID